jgi:hypothetical protein
VEVVVGGGEREEGSLSKRHPTQALYAVVEMPRNRRKRRNRRNGSISPQPHHSIEHD